MAPSAQDIIKALNLSPHPEKGYYIETFRDTDGVSSSGGRAHSTQIYYLLEGASGVSHWHRVLDASETWHHYAGAPMTLSLWKSDEDEAGKEGGSAGVRDVILGDDILAGQRPQCVVRKGEWQHARSLGDWTLVGCTVAPGFEFAGFEMAEPGWEPPVAVGGGAGK